MTTDKDAKDKDDEKNEDFKKLLFKEYDYLTNIYISNENLGENRVNIFLALTSAVLAIFAVISGSDITLIGDEVDPKFLFVASITLFALLLFGLITLQRIITRNLETTRYVNKLDNIRQYLVDEKEKLKLKALAYNPYKERKVRKLEKIFSFDRGGLLQTMALMNCIIIVGLAISLLSLMHLEFTNNILIVIYIIIVVPVFLGSWIIQMMYTRNKYDEETKKKEEKKDE